MFGHILDNLLLQLSVITVLTDSTSWILLVQYLKKVGTLGNLILFPVGMYKFVIYVFKN